MLDLAPAPPAEAPPASASQLPVVAPSARRSAHPGAVLRWLGDLPGRLGDAVLPAADPRHLPEHPLSPATLEAIVRQSPRGNAYLSLEPGLRTFATADGVLTWATSARHAFAVGGLHAAPGDGTRLLAAFRHALDAAGYARLLLFPVATAERPVAQAAGFGLTAVGAEAFIDTTTFTLAGHARVDLRQMVNRGVKRHHVRVDEVPPARAAAVLDAVYRQWLAARPVADPMVLLVGTPRFERPAGRRYFAAWVPARPDPVAFVTVTPGWSGRGAGVDVMARLPDAPAGAMDVLLTRVIGRLADEGVGVLSLGACPMAERTPLPWPESRLLRGVFRALYCSRLGNRLFPFASLARYKDKFAPRWEAVHLAAWPRVDVWSLYAGCRLWGLFGSPSRVLTPPPPPRAQLPPPARLPAP